MAHWRGFEAAKGYDYFHASLQDTKLHQLQHKFDGFGKKNCDRGPNAKNKSINNNMGLI
ncbi:MAG: hypothetical protein EB127_22335 [Alphaproteobacteria bacterium]|nr:hypothetical protein [Alphaproteobacteria bacterium]